MDITTEQREELRREWVAALRSGKYRQGKHRLLDGGRHCCLGVACEVIEEKFPGTINKCGDLSDTIVSFNGESQVLPKIAEEFLGISDCGGSFYNEEKSQTLVDLNDGGKTFSEIADLIESRPSGLFVD